MKLTRHRHDTPVLITEAEPSLSVQHDQRKRKYVIMMSTRVVCLVLAAVSYRIPALMLVFAIAAVALPWMAVLVANDRPAKRGLRLNPFHHRPGDGPRQIGPDRTALPPAAGDSRTVDPDG